MWMPLDAFPVVNYFHYDEEEFQGNGKSDGARRKPTRSARSRTRQGGRINKNKKKDTPR